MPGMYRSYCSGNTLYNSGRSRYWIDYEELYNWLVYYYGSGSSRRNNRTTGRQGGGGRVDKPKPEAPKPKPKPEPPKEELAKVLTVKSVNCCIKANAFNHRTDKYENVRKRKTDEGELIPADCVLRRGQNFDIKIEFDRPYDKDKHDMKIAFSFGEDGKPARGSYVELKMDETGTQKFKAGEWGATLAGCSGNTITVTIKSPADCLVGLWDLDIISLSSGKDEKGEDKTIRFVYEDCTDIYILFNPWCKDDQVYMPTEKLLDEYVLNQTGYVYQGSAYQIRAKPWDFAQFDDKSFMASLKVLNDGFRVHDSPAKANPVNVVRRICLMVNNKVLRGNWSGDYAGGMKPWMWKGSCPILEKFLETGEIVKFGQCWVFSALVVTICRALGIPCRSVTNFSSAHDTEKTLAIEEFIDKDGNNVSDRMTGDSVWNFHVWNEMWMARRDLRGMNKCDGWQAADSTPQEMSEGTEDVIGGMTCGPAPVAHIKMGSCMTNFDSGFIFAECNADRVQWQICEDGRLELMQIHQNRVGKNISTKKPGSNLRLDLTDCYKFPEGSKEERQAVLHAHECAGNPIEGQYDAPEYQKDVQFKFSHPSEYELGQPLCVDLKVINKQQEERSVSKVAFKVMSETYQGYLSEPFFKKEFNNVCLMPGSNGEDCCCSIELKEEEYLPKLFEMGGICLEIMCVVAKSANFPEQRTLKKRSFTFKVPTLQVTGPEKAKVGEQVTYKVTFKNPLNTTSLTECEIEGESSAFKRWESRKIPDIPPGGEITEEFTFTTKRAVETDALFELDTKQIQDINGSCPILVEDCEEDED